MSGGGIGSALGTGLGVLLAPETGGLSMMIPAIAGAAGGALGGALTHDKNPLMDALLGGVGGGLTGGLSGGLDAAGLFSDAAGSSGASGIGNLAANEAADTAALGSAYGPAAEGAASNGAMSAIPSILPSTAPSAASGASGNSILGGLGTYLGKQNPLNLALAGGSILSGVQSLLPHPQVNVGQNAANVMATNPSFSQPLPKYTMQNTATPYSGNWYTYGQTPQTAMYNAMPIPAKRGGLMKYAAGGMVEGNSNQQNYRDSAMRTRAMMDSNPLRDVADPVINRYMNSDYPGTLPQYMHDEYGDVPITREIQNNSGDGKGYAQGGCVKGYAMGGMPPMPTQGAPAMPQAPLPVNPLTLAAAHKVGVVLGQHLKKALPTHNPLGQVHGAGGGHDDKIPARLSQDEFVMPADIPSMLGDGSSNEGAKILTKFMHNVRAHKTSNKGAFPPKAKNPLKYLPKKAMA